MTVQTNKQLVGEAFAALGSSDARPLIGLMSEDFVWAVEGQTSFSRRFEGKAAVEKDLLGALFEAFATPYRFAIEEIIAEGDRVVVMGTGSVRTKWGKDYNNSYCFVIRMRDGKMIELREYLDTALVESVFGSRAAAAEVAE